MSAISYLGREVVTRADLADCQTDLKMKIDKETQDTEQRIKDEIKVKIAEVKVKVAEVKAEVVHNLVVYKYQVYLNWYTTKHKHKWWFYSE